MKKIEAIIRPERLEQVKKSPGRERDCGHDCDRGPGPGGAEGDQAAVPGRDHGCGPAAKAQGGDLCGGRRGGYSHEDHMRRRPDGKVRGRQDIRLFSGEVGQGEDGRGLHLKPIFSHSIFASML